MKKALIVTRVSGFVPQFEMNNVRTLQKMGYEVHYAANLNVIVYGNDNSRLEGTGMIIHHIEFCRSPFSKQVVKCYKQLMELMEKEHFDLIHCHMPITGVLTRLAAHQLEKRTKRHIPLIYTAHGLHFYKGAPLKNWIYYFPERVLVRYTDCIIMINEEDYRRVLTFPKHKLVKKVHGIGINLEKYKCNLKCNKEGNKTLNLVSVGEITKRKNHIVVIKAINKLKDKIPVHYTICGNGPLKEELENYVKSNNLQEMVSFPGYVENISQMLQQQDIFVFPSLQEGLPVALMEAMAAGMPVIANNIRGNCDLLSGEGGYLLDKGNAEQYSEAVINLYNRSGEWEKMGLYNRKKVHLFDQSVVKEEMEKIYMEVTGGE